MITKTTKILILHVEAGYGHRKVAEAISEALEKRRDSNLVVEVADAIKKTNRLFEASYARLYQGLVVWVPWLWGFFFWLTNQNFVYSLIRPFRTFWNWLQSDRLRAYVIEQNFDFILFTHFFPAEVCATLKRKGLIRAQLITVVTDVIPHAVWQNKGTDVYWVMAEESRKALLDRDASLQRVYVKGIPIGSKFFQETNPAFLRQKFGLSDHRLTLLFTSGSFGIGPTETMLEHLGARRDRVQVMVVCGKNRKLFQILNQNRYPFSLILFGLIDNMHELMSVADLLVAKPGGATMCESLVKKVPMLISSTIPGQEAYNAKWLLQKDAALKLNHPSDFPLIIKKLLQEPSMLQTLRNSIDVVAKPHAGDDLVDFLYECLKIQERANVQ